MEQGKPGYGQAFFWSFLRMVCFEAVSATVPTITQLFCNLSQSVGGMDAFGRGIRIAAAIRNDGGHDEFEWNRHSSLDSMYHISVIGLCSGTSVFMTLHAARYMPTAYVNYGPFDLIIIRVKQRQNTMLVIILNYPCHFCGICRAHLRAVFQVVIVPRFGKNV